MAAAWSSAFIPADGSLDSRRRHDARYTVEDVIAEGDRVVLRVGFTVVLLWALAAGGLRAVQIGATGWPFNWTDPTGRVLLVIGGILFFAAGAFAAIDLRRP